MKNSKLDDLDKNPNHIEMVRTKYQKEIDQDKIPYDNKKVWTKYYQVIWYFVRTPPFLHENEL